MPGVSWSRGPALSPPLPTPLPSLSDTVCSPTALFASPPPHPPSPYKEGGSEETRDGTAPLPPLLPSSSSNCCPVAPDAFPSPRLTIIRDSLSQCAFTFRA